MHPIPESELILHPDGSVYHLHLLPEDLATTIILVGDPDRVPQVSRYFDHIEIKKQKREFITHTGRIGRERISVISTGIGTGNIDIVLNEINLLLNVDLHTRTFYPERKKARIIRIGTSGSVHPDIQVDQLLVSASAIGLEGLPYYYPPHTQAQPATDFIRTMQWPAQLATPYLVQAGANLLHQVPSGIVKGCTLTTQGFYLPQGRSFQKTPDILLPLKPLHQSGVTNIEMETAGIYFLSAHFGFEAISWNAILANRIHHTFSNIPEKTIDACIQLALSTLYPSQ